MEARDLKPVATPPKRVLEELEAIEAEPEQSGIEAELKQADFTDDSPIPDKIYRILGNFRGKIISLFSWISLQPRKFNYMNIFQ